MQPYRMRRSPLLARAQAIFAPFASLAALPFVKSARAQFLADYPNTFYAYALQAEVIPRPRLTTSASSHSAPSYASRDLETDVCVVGGGFAGLATAMGLVERGKKVRHVD